MIVDAIMLALSTSDELFKMTQSAIDSLHNSETDFQFNIVLLESNKNSQYHYENCTTLVPDIEAFNYNKYMNYGIQKTINEYIILCNNDLVFHKGWFSAIYKHRDKSDSFSSWNNIGGWHEVRIPEPYPEFIEGYKIGTEVGGWCLVVKRSVFDVITLDDRVSFWFSDNVYIDALRKNNMKHGIVTNSFVDHLLETTSKTLSNKERYKLRDAQREIYNKIK